MSRLFLTFVCCALALKPVPVAAQSHTFAEREETLARLAQTLGRAHAVRVLCNGRADQHWRNFVQELIDVEAPRSETMRSRIVNDFNYGFTSEQNRLGGCRRDARSIEVAYADAGQRLAASLAGDILDSNAEEADAE